MRLADLFAEHALAGYEKQIALDQLAGDAPWNLNLETGQFKLGSHLFGAQILGTEAADSNTWLWAWANPSIPETMTDSAKEVREIGRTQGIEELIKDRLVMHDPAVGHVFSLIASDLVKATAYYRGPYSGGAVFVVLSGDPLVRDSPHAQTIVNVVTTAVANLPIENHQRAYEAYLQRRGLEVIRVGRDLHASTADGRVIVASFDRSSRRLESVGTRTA